MTEVKVDCSRTELPPFVLRTTTVTSLTGDPCAAVHAAEGVLIAEQLYSTNVSTRYDLPSGPVFVCVGRQDGSVLTQPVT